MKSQSSLKIKIEIKFDVKFLMKGNQNFLNYVFTIEIIIIITGELIDELRAK